MEDAVRSLESCAQAGTRPPHGGPEHKDEINAIRRDQMLRRLTLKHVDALLLTGALAVSVIAYAVLFTNVNGILN